MGIILSHLYYSSECIRAASLPSAVIHGGSDCIVESPLIVYIVDIVSKKGLLVMHNYLTISLIL